MRFSFIACIAALGGLLFGYDTGVISGALLFLRGAFHLSPTMLGVLTSIALAGATLGAAAAGPLADRWGRRPLLLATAIVFIIGAVFSALAWDLSSLLCGRLLVGFSIGGASMLTPLYIAEISPAQRRGALVSLNQLAITAGILMSYLVGYAFAKDGAWRWMLGIGGLPGVILATGLLFLPETPRWFASKGRMELAKTALRRLRGAKADIGAEYATLQAELKNKTQDPKKLPKKALRMPMIVGIGLAVFQQVTGINTVIYFAPTIFQAAGLSSASAAILATAGIGLINMLMTIVAIRLIDHVGRRVLLLTGLGGMAAGLCILGVGFLFGAGHALGWIIAGSLAAYVGFFAIGLGPVFWLLVSEIFPLSIRGRGMSAATIANWLANLAVTLTFLDMVDWLGRPAVFFLYAGLSLGALIFSYLYVPETKNLSLEAIEELWTE
jgi:SP family galactose:H+ symporter-like MFS transporter